MAQVTSKSSRRTSLGVLGLFALSVLLLAGMFSVLAQPWVHLSWWRTFRRCVSIASAVSLWLVITKIERRSLRSYGFLDWRTGKYQLGLGLLLGIGSLVTLLGVGVIAGWCRIALSPDRFKLWTLLLGFLPAAILVGVLEELVFRGFLLQRLMAYSHRLAIIGSSVVYALVHLKNPEISLLTCLELGGLFLLGWVLSLSYLKTGQLYLPVGLHAMLAYGARVNKVLIEFPHVSLAWLSGTSRLVNGLLGWTILCVMAGMFYWGGGVIFKRRREMP